MRLKFLILCEETGSDYQGIRIPVGMIPGYVSITLLP